MLLHISKIFFKIFFPLLESQWNFSPIFTVGDQSSSWRYVLQYCCPLQWGPGILTLTLCFAEASTNYSSSFPTSALVPMAVFACEPLISKQWLPVSICFLSNLVFKWFVLCPPFPYGSKKSLSLYLLLGYSGNFSNSLHIELAMRSIYVFLLGI